MQLDIYVNYRGNSEEAFRFYEQHLGGKLTGIVRHGDQPNPATPADWTGKVLHARIEIGGTVLMGADVAQAKPMRSAYLFAFTGPRGGRGTHVRPPCGRWSNLKEITRRFHTTQLTLTSPNLPQSG